MEDPRANYVRGWARLRQDKAEAAREDLDAAIAGGFVEAIAYHARALVAYYLGEYRAAATDYTEAIERGLEGPAVFEARGDAYLALEEYESAEKDLSTAIFAGGGGAEV